MLAGETNIKVGTRVKIKGITDPDDIRLNGYRGKVTHPFASGETSKGWVGIWLDDLSVYNGHCNVKVSEIEILEGN